MTSSLDVLRRVMRPRERRVPGERCDMCGEPIGDRHGHVADVGDRRLMCTCRGCYLLFTREGAGGARMRAVPEEYRRLDEFAFTQEQWDDLAVPVDLVFLFWQSAADSETVSETEPADGAPAEPARRLVALYPSPGGATESELDEASWQQVVAANPSLATLADDVQAVLLRRIAAGEFICFVVPVDVCYELVGLVRRNWSGLSGGREVWAVIDEFFDKLRARAR